MPSTNTISFAGPPSIVPAFARVLLSKKPYIAPDGIVIEPIDLEVRTVRISRAHLQRYKDICGVPASMPPTYVPPAYLHVLAMPLHMQLFVAQKFPVKVLGLIHLRNTIRVIKPFDLNAPLRLHVHFDTMRLTDVGQEYDFTTRYEQDGAVVWEEISTMFARGNKAPKAGAKRPTMERSNHPQTGTLTQTLAIAENTGWRYARVSGDFNPIHLTARTAAMFGFKQAVSHGMWSMGRCLGAAAEQLPAERIQVDAQFMLPVYLPSQALARSWPKDSGVDIAMCTMRGDRLHLTMQVRKF